MIVIICKEYGWTYWEYMSQPAWFVELTKTKLIIDNEKEIRNIRKNNLERR